MLYIVQEEIYIRNLGHITSGPKAEGTEQIVVEYTGGDTCTAADGTKKNYTTKIHLRCQKGLQVRGWCFSVNIKKCISNEFSSQCKEI